jgi:Flp pilus assembly protein TadG
MSRLARLFRRLGRDDRGAIAVQFALLAIPLSILVFALIDLGRISLQRHQMQDALDAATLIAARSTAVTDTELEAVGDPAFLAEIVGLNLNLTASNASFKAGTGNHILGTATATVKPIIANLWTKSDFTVTAASDVVRSSKNLEVAVVLDITGSMSGTRITDLKTGASDLVDIVVKDDQAPFYSKVAIVPYSVGVNVGSYADAVRGAVPVRAISGVSKANSAVVSSASHGFIVGDKVTISGVSGPTMLNGNTYNVTAVSANNFTINANTSNAPSYVSGGVATCDTSTNPGCKNFTYTSASNTTVTRALSTCVTERIGTYAYADMAPSVALVGRNYPTSSNPCPGANITPLSSDRVALKSQINALSAAGSTAGQVGFAWGWYMVSPNFGYLWPSATQRPAPYNGKDLVKVVVLMTDGAFNTPYCKGVIAKDAGSGSGLASDHINCAATNGDAFTQTRKLCDAMKDPALKLTIFTVGFDVGNDANAVSMLKYCATDAQHVYFPATGSELKTAFKSIAQEISALRIAK